MKIGVDLLWVRPGKNGGTESVVRNILDGFCTYADKEFSFTLYVSKQNADSFVKYTSDERFKLHICNCNSNSQIKRVLWETCFLNSIGSKDGIDIWYYPVYSRPFFISNKIKNVTVIHDLQALHYPEYFSKFRNLFFRLAWKQDCKNSDEIITISNYCKKDILSNYRIPSDKVKVIYNSVNSEGKSTNFSVLEKRYGIKSNEYYYTVCSLAKHKNLITLLKAIKEIKKTKREVKLLVTGVKVNAENEILGFIKENNLTENIIYTGFISDEDRNALYDNCYKFVFPSVFEGFGMPPIEAMLREKPVITTNKTSLSEVTLGLCDYVEDPFDEKEWAKLMIDKNSKLINKKERDLLLQKYSLENTAEAYLKEFIKLKKI